MRHLLCLRSPAGRTIVGSCGDSVVGQGRARIIRLFLPHNGDNWFHGQKHRSGCGYQCSSSRQPSWTDSPVHRTFVIATHNQLSRTHPLFLLLTPHFEGTLASTKVPWVCSAPAGLVDVLLASSIINRECFAVKAAQSYQLNLNTSMLPQTLAQRGVDDASCLPDYPIATTLCCSGAQSINGWKTT